jgi:hypothetical protein
MYITPKRVEKPSAGSLYALSAFGAWVIGWPIAYTIFASGPKSEAVLWLTHAAAVVWVLSLIGFCTTLAIIKDGSPFLFVMWDIASFTIQVLLAFLCF